MNYAENEMCVFSSNSFKEKHTLEKIDNSLFVLD